MKPLAYNVPLTDRPPAATYRTGPGALEMVTITTWTRREIGRIRISGYFDVFCGHGGTHRVPVSAMSSTREMFSVLGEPNGRTWDGPYPTVDDAAAELVEWALWNWTDPCDDADEDDER